MNVVNNLANSTANVSTYLKNNSPKILSISSLILEVGAVAATAYGTWKSKDVIEEHNFDIKCMHEGLEAAKDETEKDQIRKDILNRYIETGMTVAGNYILPATLLGGSIACNRISSSQYETRIKGLNEKLAMGAAAYALLKNAYDKAQERAEEKLGKEEACDIFYGSGEEKEVEVTDAKGKKKVKKVKEWDPYKIIESNPCAVLLGEGIECNLEFSKDSLWYDINFVNSVENRFTYELNSKGYVKVYDVFKELGIKPQSKFQKDIWTSYGWIKDQNKIDNYIKKCKAEGLKITDEGIMMANRIDLGLDNFINQKYIEGIEPTVWIIPNQMGDIDPFIFSDAQYIEATAI